MTEGMRNERVTYDIISTLGQISRKGDMTLEVNLVSWNGRPPKVDIRKWNDDHTVMSKGITLSDEEAQAVCEALKARYEA